MKKRRRSPTQSGGNREDIVRDVRHEVPVSDHNDRKPVLNAHAPTRTRIVVASLIGTTIEWYDFFLYGAAAALVFNKIFFPQADPLIGTLLAFTTYALGFIARPLGGAIFGHFGDKIGRKKLLMLSLVLMGLSTMLIGFLPTYHQAGLVAPLLLVLLRLVQGFAVGGEWGGAVLIVAEYGEARTRGFWASWAQVGAPAGNLLAAAVLAIMSAIQSEQDFLVWGWRVPFLLSAVLIAIGWWVRAVVEESPVFLEAKAARTTDSRDSAQKRGPPLLDVLLSSPRALAIGAGLRLGENIGYYILTAFSITYITEVVHLSRGLALDALLLGAAAECIIIPFFAALSDRIGRRPVYALGAIGMAIWDLAFFRMLDTGATPAIIAALVGGLFLHGVMYGPQAAFMAELFPTRTRYSGVSLAYQVSSILAGSLAPIIALTVMKTTGSAASVAIYMSVACVVTAIAALCARETKGKSFAEIDAEIQSRVDR